MSFRKSRWAAAWASALALLGVAYILLPFSVLAAPPRVGESFPKLADFGLEGSIPETKGKVVLIDFWASWCAPCKKSFPVMKEVQEKFASRGFIVIAVSVDESKQAMDAFLKKNPGPFAVLHDFKGRLAEAAALDKMPTSFLVDANGTVAAVHSGFDGEATRKQYLAEVEAALKASGK